MTGNDAQATGGSTEVDYVESTTTRPRGCGTITHMLSIPCINAIKGSPIAQHDSDDDSPQSIGMGIVEDIFVDNRGYR